MVRRGSAIARRDRVFGFSARVGERDDAGRKARFNAGSIAVHTLGVPFPKRNLRRTRALSWAEKKIPHVDLATGEIVQPQKNNGLKLEKFIFDAIPMCPRIDRARDGPHRRVCPSRTRPGSIKRESCARDPERGVPPAGLNRSVYASREGQTGASTPCSRSIRRTETLPKTSGIGSAGWQVAPGARLVI